MPRRTRKLVGRTVLVVLVGLCAAESGGAQGLTTRAAAPADVTTLDDIIGAFYDVISGPAGEARDWARDSTLYLAAVRFRYTSGEGAARRWVIVEHAQFARDSEPFLHTGFFEREIHRVTRRFGDIAHVFSTYEWTSPTEQGPQRGRGINSIELIFQDGRWWISYAQWQAETPDQPIPDEYLPTGNRRGGN